MNQIKMHMSENRGFVRIIVTLIVILVIINLAGLDATRIWTEIFQPVFSFIGNIIVVAADWVVNLLREGWSIFQKN